MGVNAFCILHRFHHRFHSYLKILYNETTFFASEKLAENHAESAAIPGLRTFHKIKNANAPSRGKAFAFTLFIQQ